MKIAERQLFSGIIGPGIVSTHGFMQERGRNPDAELGGPICVAAGFRVTQEITDYLVKRGKPLEKWENYAVPISLIAGLGVTWGLCKITGKKWNTWVGRFSVVAVRRVLREESRRRYLKNNEKGKHLISTITISVAVLCCYYFLEKRRNPSLAIKPYIIHTIATMSIAMIAMSALGFQMFKRDKRLQKEGKQAFSWEEDARNVYALSMSLISSYVVAKVIQKGMGEKALKFNWKVQALCTGLFIANYMTFMSKNSPIYED